MRASVRAACSRNFYDRRIAAEIEGDNLGDEFKGYVFRISGGNDKQGFPMVQGILSSGRVRLLLTKGAKAYKPRRTGERKRRSVRGCIVGADLSVPPPTPPRCSPRTHALTCRAIPSVRPRCPRAYPRCHRMAQVQVLADVAGYRQCCGSCCVFLLECMQCLWAAAW